MRCVGIVEGVVGVVGSVLTPAVGGIEREQRDGSKIDAMVAIVMSRVGCPVGRMLKIEEKFL